MHFLETTVCTKGDHKPAEGIVGLVSHGGNAPQSLVPSCSWSSYPGTAEASDQAELWEGCCFLCARLRAVPSALLRLEQVEVVAMPTGGVCWLGSCGQATELPVEMSRLHGIRQVRHL